MDSKQGNMQKSHWHFLQLNIWNKLSILLTVSSNCTPWQRRLLEKKKGKKRLTTSLWDISKAITASPLFKKLWNDEQMEMRKETVEWQRGFSHRLQEQWGMPGRCTIARAESVWSNTGNALPVNEIKTCWAKTDTPVNIWCCRAYTKTQMNIYQNSENKGGWNLPWKERSTLQGSKTTKMVVIFFQLRHSQGAINRGSWFSIYLSVFWGERVPVLFSGSMRSLHKIYGKLKTHLKINSRLLVRWEAETLNRWKGEKEQCTAWGHYQFTEKLQDTQSMSCEKDGKGLSAFSVHWLHSAMKLQACLMEASHISCFYPCQPMCSHTTVHCVCTHSYFIFLLRL